MTTDEQTAYTSYVRDASGNVMGVYEQPVSSEVMRLKEHHLYGSSRLGVWSRDLDIDQPKQVVTEEDLLGHTYVANFERGYKFFELSNHLGNVLTTISDKRTGVDEGSNGTIDHYTADVVTANDYYPFGMLTPGRKFNANNLNRYGFNGKENDNDVKGEENQQDYGMRIYDPRVGKFLSVDPLTTEYPWNSTYAFAENDVVRSVDLDGAEKDTRTFYYGVSNGQTVLKVVDNNYKQPEGTSNLGTLLRFGSPKTDEQEAAGGFLETMNLPDGGVFTFFEFAPELKKENYARYEYLDAGGVQHIRYFTGEHVAFIFNSYKKAHPRNAKKLQIIAALASAAGSGKLLNAELKAANVEIRASTTAVNSVTLPATSPKFNPGKPALAQTSIKIPSSKVMRQILAEQIIYIKQPETN